MNIYDLFESVDIIVDAKLKQMQLDKTILCTIIDDTQKQYGKYVVSHDNLTFVANAASGQFDVNDLVYISVPGSDYSNAFIISKKLKATELAYQVDPFANYFKMREYSSFQGCVLNSAKLDDCIVWDEGGDTIQPIDDINKYDYVGIEFSLQSHCIQEHSKGYAIHLFITTKETDASNENYYNVLHTHTLHSSEMMISNAYLFSNISKQKILFNIKDLNSIVAMKIQFECFDKDLAAEESLELSELTVSYGYSLLDYKEPSAYIYTLDSDLNYNTTNKTKNLFLRWIYKEKNKLQVITYTNAQECFAKTGASIIWQKLINGNWVNNTDLSQLDYSGFSYSDELNVFKDNEQYRCKIQYYTYDSEAPIEYLSNIIEFTNLNSVNHEQLIDSIKLFAANDKFTDYYLPSGMIVDQTLAAQQHQITLTCQLSEQLIKLLNDNTENIQLQITWYSPNDTESMINIVNLVDFIDGKYTIASDTHSAVLDNISAQGILTSSIYFYINEYYSPSYINNTISVDVTVLQNGEILQQKTAEKSFMFTKFGLAEKDYNLIFEMYNLNNDRIHSIRPGENITIKAKLYDYQGKEIEAVGGYNWSWYRTPANLGSVSNPNKNFLTLLNYENSLVCRVEANVSLAPPNFQGLFDATFILQAKYEMKQLQENTTVKEIIGYLPIAINNSLEWGMDISNIAGPSLINYSSLGGSPSYVQTPYKAYNPKNEPFQLNWKRLLGGVLVDESEKYTKYISTVSSIVNNMVNQQAYYPSLVKINLTDFCLAPRSVYFNDANLSFSIVGYGIDNIDDSILFSTAPAWIQPIVCTQTRSFSSFINDWNGSFAIDENKNQIMSARLGAGKINKKGKFSGVLLGDWSDTTSDQTLPLTGVYGFNESVQTYGLRENGTAFFGTAGTGRIEFDGNQGIIQSSAFDGIIDDASGEVKDQGTAGSYWNLKTGEFVTNNGYFRGRLEADSGYFAGEVMAPGKGLYSGIETVDLSHLPKGLENDSVAFYTGLYPHQIVCDNVVETIEKWTYVMSGNGFMNSRKYYLLANHQSPIVLTYTYENLQATSYFIGEVLAKAIGVSNSNERETISTWKYDGNFLQHVYTSAMDYATEVDGIYYQQPHIIYNQADRTITVKIFEAYLVTSLPLAYYELRCEAYGASLDPDVQELKNNVRLAKCLISGSGNIYANHMIAAESLVTDLITAYTPHQGDGTNDINSYTLALENYSQLKLVHTNVGDNPASGWRAYDWQSNLKDDLSNETKPCFSGVTSATIYEPINTANGKDIMSYTTFLTGSGLYCANVGVSADPLDFLSSNHNKCAYIEFNPYIGWADMFEDAKAYGRMTIGASALTYCDTDKIGEGQTGYLKVALEKNNLFNSDSCCLWFLNGALIQITKDENSTGKPDGKWTNLASTI